MPQTSNAFPVPNARPALRARTFRCMGTVVSLTVPGALAGSPSTDDELAAAAAVVERLFLELDQTFSLYRPGSEASSMAFGGLTMREASASMRERYAEALEWRLRTEGAFTPERPDGVLDLSGLVKGHALRDAGTSLRALGRLDWCLNAGGDVLVSGSPKPGSNEPWKAGIVDPLDRQKLAACYPLPADGHHAALATSGSAERGDHIWTTDGVGGKSAFVQVSVAAADIVTADVLATAIVAGGMPMLDRAADGWDVSILVLRADGELLATPGFRAQRLRA
jgi:thiamine biosynthesis lipoprotein